MDNWALLDTAPFVWCPSVNISGLPVLAIPCDTLWGWAMCGRVWQCVAMCDTLWGWAGLMSQGLARSPAKLKRSADKCNWNTDPDSWVTAGILNEASFTSRGIQYFFPYWELAKSAMRKSWSRIWCGIACKKCKWFVEAMTGHTKCFECGEWCCAGLRRCHQRTIRPRARRLLCNANQNADASMQCFEDLVSER